MLFLGGEHMTKSSNIYHQLTKLKDIFPTLHPRTHSNPVDHVITCDYLVPINDQGHGSSSTLQSHPHNSRPKGYAAAPVQRKKRPSVSSRRWGPHRHPVDASHFAPRWMDLNSWKGGDSYQNFVVCLTEAKGGLSPNICYLWCNFWKDGEH